MHSWSADYYKKNVYKDKGFACNHHGLPRFYEKKMFWKRYIFVSFWFVVHVYRGWPWKAMVNGEQLDIIVNNQFTLLIPVIELLVITVLLTNHQILNIMPFWNINLIIKQIQICLSNDH